MYYGLSKIDITPKEPVFQEGYGFRETKSESVHAPVYVKALALGKDFVVLCFDLCILDTEFVDALKARIPLPADRILVSYTHTHSGPALIAWLKHGPNPEYRAFALEAGAKAAQEALANLAEGELSFGVGETYIGVKRNLALPTGAEPERVIDRKLAVLTVRDTKGDIKVIWCEAACHAVIVTDYGISGDFPAQACKELEEAYPGAVAMYSQGCCGDTNPILMHLDFDAAIMTGKVLANDVKNVIRFQSRPFRLDLASTIKEVTLPLGEDQIDFFKGKAADTDPVFHAYGERMLAAIADGTAPKTIPFRVMAVRLGKGIGMVTLEGEAVSFFARSMRERWADDDLAVLGYSNGYRCYIPSIEKLHEGGYETTVTYEWGGFRAPYTEEVEGIVTRAMDEAWKAVR